jgi:hypothetical protein
LNLAKLMLMKEVSFNQKKPGGSKTRIELMDPRAFCGTAVEGGPSGDAWSIDEEG